MRFSFRTYFCTIKSIERQLDNWYETTTFDDLERGHVLYLYWLKFAIRRRAKRNGVPAWLLPF